MRIHIVTALAVFLAAPAMGAIDKHSFTAVATPPVDWLYPEVDVDEAGFRGLIPVILLDMESAAKQEGEQGDKQAN